MKRLELLSQKPKQLAPPYLLQKCSTRSPWGQKVRSQNHKSQKHCRRGSLHSCGCWLLLVLRASSHLHFVLRLAVLDPDFALTLRVDEQWKPSRLGDNETVLNGQLVARQTFQIPFTYCWRFHQHVDDIQILTQTSIKNSSTTHRLTEILHTLSDIRTLVNSLSCVWHNINKKLLTYLLTLRLKAWLFEHVYV